MESVKSMDLALAFAVFAGSMTGVLTAGRSMLWAMFAGFAAFLCAGLRRGFPLGELLRMSAAGARESFIVARVMLTIGVLTGLWRSGGVFALLTAWGIRLIAPEMFVLAAFLLPAVLSYAIGTSFGTAGTLGVALMALARSGGVDELVAAGAVMSGIYFGDRCSPASSCAHLVASLTSTDLYANIRMMMRTALLPILLSAVFYLLLSLRSPLAAVDSETLEALERAFDLSPWGIAPAALMLVLPLLGVGVFRTFLASIVCAFACTVLIQGMSVPEALWCALRGFRAEEGIRALFNGGGLASMVELSLVLIVSGTYSGIFDGTRMLDGLQARVLSLAERIGIFPVALLVGILSNAVFCSQALGVMVTNQIMKRPYGLKGLGEAELVQDISNSTVPTAGLVPWCLGCSVPLAMLGVPPSAIPWAVYLYLLPLCYALTRGRWFKAAA